MSSESDAARLKARVARIQALVASLPDLDARSDDEIIGYDERGLPAEEHSALRETLEVLSSSAQLERIQTGLRELAEGETASFEDIFGEPL